MQCELRQARGHALNCELIDQPGVIGSHETEHVEEAAVGRFHGGFQPADRDLAFKLRCANACSSCIDNARAHLVLTREVLRGPSQHVVRKNAIAVTQLTLKTHQRTVGVAELLALLVQARVLAVATLSNVQRATTDSIGVQPIALA